MIMNVQGTQWPKQWVATAGAHQPWVKQATGQPFRVAFPCMCERSMQRVKYKND
ncbi:hypothetical protein SAMN04488511_12822 [Pedobacter suwonensis]|uniref:Uncharacterized protein n=1 Tax=Pedobacter suwonensis TaxID=332999 RepID=A0A1I0U8Q9_9SPHI|nr:hypothetical protein [Pedobacter suwonensis]SFA60431.1 hypothetical protein SAMN04488511_12822 [Pedobacter suwonensis]